MHPDGNGDLSPTPMSAFFGFCRAGVRVSEHIPWLLLVAILLVQLVATLFENAACLWLMRSSAAGKDKNLAGNSESEPPRHPQGRQTEKPEPAHGMAARGSNMSDMEPGEVESPELGDSDHRASRDMRMQWA